MCQIFNYDEFELKKSIDDLVWKKEGKIVRCHRSTWNSFTLLFNSANLGLRRACAGRRVHVWTGDRTGVTEQGRFGLEKEGKKLDFLIVQDICLLFHLLFCSTKHCLCRAWAGRVHVGTDDRPGGTCRGRFGLVNRRKSRKNYFSEICLSFHVLFHSTKHDPRQAWAGRARVWTDDRPWGTWGGDLIWKMEGNKLNFQLYRTFAYRSIFYLFYGFTPLDTVYTELKLEESMSELMIGQEVHNRVGLVWKIEGKIVNVLFWHLLIIPRVIYFTVPLR